MLIAKRLIHVKSNRSSVSIVGSGPSGFYTAYHLLNKSRIPLDITIWEKLPTPFGLSRYGVAPDHPEVKNCEKTFTAIANKFSGNVDPKMHSFRFIGNVTVGKDVPLKSLLDNQDVVVLSYGCGADKKLRIPGEEGTRGVFTSRQFVNWYNGHPEFSDNAILNEFDWSNVRKVGIIGNGNVSLDIARLLVSAQVGEIWNKTDINPNALRLLRTAPIEDVRLIARRDFLHSKFTNKELREIWELERYGIQGLIEERYFNPSRWDLSTADRGLKRRIQMCEEYMKPFHERKGKSYTKYPPPAEGYSKRVVFDYLKSPIRINKDQHGVIKSITVCKNSLTPTKKVFHHIEDTIEYDVDLLITSLGYRGEMLPEFTDLNIKFDNNRIVNDRGQVLDTTSNPISGLFTSGWINKGSTGVIMNTMNNSFEVGDNIINYLTELPTTLHKLRTPDDIVLCGTKATTWSDWLKMDSVEKERAINGQPRQKLLTVAEMLSHVCK
ncbi:NADPH-adrenodoxin reductase Ecym_4641 [Eremothecium cymbalariae DBVPG|uniref:NADPH:adrenodoxin oxidoreductase, mitochondrial n=1 Tax=Eremothecium cymbalariae (strain CBS 270.75 / DBVPG 7215 / KCTC 17166 / NRRL Y-17582) TaxID=931890 RepID=G8JSE2_ERECY|nr:hypothetical protein Ecym_4641 [Eremothecium cymbalariae DBVPG\